MTRQRLSGGKAAPLMTTVKLLTLAAIAALAAGLASYANAAGGGTETVATIDVGGTPSSIVATPRAIWVSTGLGGIVRIDPRRNAVVARIRPGGAVVDLAAGFGALWAIDVFGGRLLRIDPRTARVAGRSRIGDLPSGVAVGHGLVWVASQLRSTVSGVDPRTGRVVKLVRFSYGELWPGGIAVTRDGVWAITGGGNELTLVDPERMVIARRVAVRGARTLAPTGRSLWVGLAGPNGLLRVDPGRTAHTATHGLPADGYGPALAGGVRLWVATSAGVAFVDPADGAVRAVRRLPAGRDVAAIASAGDVWIADGSGTAVVRVPRADAGGRPLAASGGGGALHRAASPRDHPKG